MQPGVSTGSRTRVFVYSLGPGGSVEAFVGFGSLVFPGLVALHPHRHSIQVAPPATDASAGATDATEVVAPGPARVSAPGALGGAFRCVIHGAAGEQDVLDGDLVPGGQGPGGEPMWAVSLPLDSSVPHDTVPSGPSSFAPDAADYDYDDADLDAAADPEAVAALVAETTDAMWSFLVEVEAADDPVLPLPTDPSRTGDGDDGPSQPGKRPPWCSIWPGAWGC